MAGLGRRTRVALVSLWIGLGACAGVARPEQVDGQLLPPPFSDRGVSVKAESFARDDQGRVLGLRGAATNATNGTTPNCMLAYELLNEQRRVVGVMSTRIAPLPPLARVDFIAGVMASTPTTFVMVRACRLVTDLQREQALTIATSAVAATLPSMSSQWSERICKPERGEFETMEEYAKRWNPMQNGEVLRLECSADDARKGNDGLVAEYDIDKEMMAVGVRWSDYTVGMDFLDHLSHDFVKVRGVMVKTEQAASRAIIDGIGKEYGVALENMLTFAAVAGLLMERQAGSYATWVGVKFHVARKDAEHKKKAMKVRVGVSCSGAPVARMGTFAPGLPWLHYLECELRELVIVDSTDNSVMSAWALPSLAK